MTEMSRDRGLRWLKRGPSRVGLCFAFLLFGGLSGLTQGDPSVGSRNKPERLEWFRDQGFGLFIHWSVDGQLGVVISHSLVGASPDYTERFFTELPKTFNPTRFDAGEMARLAKLAGVKYVMFTAKHHSGFTMFRSESTPFGVANTPFKRDPTAEIFNAFRAQGMAAGVYFSPDDFWWLHVHGKAIKRLVPEVQPGVNPGLLAYDSGQLTELLTRYGKVDLAYFDGEAKDLREVAWKLNPEIVVTRGAFDTPELTVPSTGVAGPWEASITMGSAWQYQPDNEMYTSGHELIRLLFQTRAKGGNLLLNVGPMPNGELAIEQENRLREIWLWMFVNSECIYGVRPWIVPNETFVGNTLAGMTDDRDHVWFTRNRQGGALYAILDIAGGWDRGTWREYTLHTVKATAKTSISVLGQDDATVEYRPGLTPKSTVTQQPDGLHIRVNRAQRLQDNSRWPNAVVVKLTDVEAALVPPRVATEAPGGTRTLRGNLVDMGDAKTLEVGFEYRRLDGGEDAHVRSEAWRATGMRTVSATGAFSMEIAGLPTGPYEYHAVAKHPLLTIYGSDRTVRR